MKTFILIFLALYIIVMLILGFIGRKYANELHGFTLAGTSIGGLLAGLSIFASWMSASTFMGVPAFFYQWGWPSFALSASVTLVAPMALILTIRRLRSYATILKAYTYTDLISLRYDSQLIRMLVTLMSVVLFISIMVAQLRAIGLIFETSIGIEYWQAVILGIVVCMLYISLGGMWASLVTDGIQAIIMIATVIILLPLGFIAVGGLDGLYDGLLSHGESFVALAEPTFWTPVNNLFQPLYWGLVIFAFPYVMNRCLVLKSKKEYKNFILTFWASNALGIFFIVAGGLALVVLPQTVEPDLASLALVVEILPTALGGIVVVGIFMAVMSSVDSVLHAAGTIIGNDFFRGFIAPAFGKNPDDDTIKKLAVKISKVSVIVFTIIPIYFAIFNPPEFLSLLLYWGTGFMASGVVAPLLIGLFWKNATKYGAIFAMVGGVTVYLCLDLLTDFTIYINAPFSVFVSAVILMTVSFVEHKFFGHYSLPRNVLARINVESND